MKMSLDRRMSLRSHGDGSEVGNLGQPTFVFTDQSVLGVVMPIFWPFFSGI